MTLRAALRVRSHFGSAAREVKGTVLTRRSRQVGGPWRSLSTEAAAPDTTEKGGGGGSGGGGQDGYVAFPWRTAPEVRKGLWDTVTSAVGELVPQTYLSLLCYGAAANLMGVSSDDAPEVLMRSARFAFIQVVRGIFAGKAKVPPPTWEYTADESKCSDEHSLGYPPLPDMMDAKLVEVYQGAYEKFAAVKQQVSLDLQSVRPLSISNFRLIIGPSRGLAAPVGCLKASHFGVTVVVRNPQDDSPDWSNLMQQLRTRLVENHHYLFQMCVTFKCRERFMVTHQDTQEVLQGSSAFHDRLHRVVFEVDFDQRAQLSTDFRVIDIDDMLGGNEYMPELASEAEGADKE